MRPVIETRGLSKKYKNFKAVSDASISVNKGEVYGFLGLNGAGKTTTIKALLGLIQASSGEVYVLGKKIQRGSMGPWARVGSLVETPASYPELTVRQNLEAVRKLRDLPPDFVSGIMKKLKIDHYSEKKAGELSLGNQQRLGLARAMIHNPEVLILDEPANGLDPAGIVEIRNLFLDLALNHGVTLFISSHHLEEISRTASRIGIIHNGVLVQEVNAAELEKKRKKQLLVGCRNLGSACEVLSHKGFKPEIIEEKIIIRNDAAIRMPENITEILTRENHPPYEIRITEENLETYFLRIIGEYKEGK